jgi:dolichyl-phosphate beta-glucosyltransferase
MMTQLATETADRPTTEIALSIVIPAYNEERRLPRTLQEIARWVEQHGEPVEVIVAENASTDRTVDVVRAFQPGHAYVRLIAGLPRGKGIAVRQGMQAARGRRRFLCDADLSMPIDQLDKFLAQPADRGDVLIGSREAAGARRFNEPAYRHLMGRVYNAVVKALALPGFEDTQCGFKLFSATVADDVFAAATLSGWGFDPEVLYIARKRGYRIAEVPIDWYYNADSRVRPLHDTLQMVRDLIRIRLNDRQGLYDGHG